MPVTAEEYTGSSSFTHLHQHSIASVLDGVATAEQYANECVKRKWSAFALTEHGNLGSWPDLYDQCKKNKLKAIYGIEFYFNDYEPERKEWNDAGGKINQLRETDPTRYARYRRDRHLTVVAKNKVGYHNLIKLYTDSFKHGFYYKNKIWFDLLCKHKEGLIVTSGCLNGPVPHELRLTDGKDKPRLTSPDKRGAVDYLKKFKAAFGDDFYVELQMPGVEGDDKVFRELVILADHLKIKPVMTNDCHYIKREDSELQMIMMSIDQGVPVWDTENLFHVNSSEQYFKTRAELWERFKNNPYSKGVDDGLFERACDNTLEITEKCENIKIDASPKIPKVEGDADKLLLKMVANRLKQKGVHNDTRKFLIDGKQVTYTQQASIELNRIIEKGFSSYFLITEDMVAEAYRQGYICNARGSAGGSLICWLLGIVRTSPLPWSLSFDRFLSESRGGFMLNVQMDESKRIKQNVA